MANKRKNGGKNLSCLKQPAASVDVTHGMGARYGGAMRSSGDRARQTHTVPCQDGGH